MSDTVRIVEPEPQTGFVVAYVARDRSDSFDLQSGSENVKVGTIILVRGGRDCEVDISFSVHRNTGYKAEKRERTHVKYSDEPTPGTWHWVA
mgnify:CR=1 FL=1